MEQLASAVPLFSVIIPTRHRNDVLAECLRRLAPGVQTLSASRFEVIVTDDGSAPTAEALIKEHFQWAGWTLGPRQGPAANRNHGAKQARAAWLVFCDDDCLPEPGLLSAYSEAISNNPEVQVFEGRTSAEGAQPHPLARAPINEEGGSLWSCNFAIRRSLYEALGGFDERFPFAAMEDSDLQIRLEKRGERIVFVPAAHVAHPWLVPDYRRHWARHLKSQMIFLRIHPEEKHRFSVWAYWKVITNYYLRHFIPCLRYWGWPALKHQPLTLWGIVITSYVLIFKPDPRKMRA
ncbi:MAG: glycosyltransferase [Verrucomicrobiota bacterium]|nr:glycosyltransferase [Verrucomicrobiota bacterium]